VKLPGSGLSPEDLDRAQRLDALADLVVITMAETFKLYLRLGPDGRELTAAEAGEVRERLEAGARCGRALDAERELIELASSEIDLRPALGAVRLMQHSLTLALSDSPDRRARAMPVDELKERMRPVHAQWVDIEAKLGR
jgi:hypothetical protein